MGSPVSPVLENIYMEWLEQQANSTAPAECTPTIWKRYVDDILEIVPKDSVDKLTEHLNSIDTTGNIKFTSEQESEGKLPFLDTVISRTPEGNLDFTIYRKNSHRSISGLLFSPPFAPKIKSGTYPLRQKSRHY